MGTGGGAPPLAGRSWGYLAGRDQERRGDLEAAARRGADLLACVRGGWGAARLLEQPLALPCRWLLGFSDVTSLLWAQLAQGQGGAIHGPLLTTLGAEPAWSQERLRAVLFGETLAPCRVRAGLAAAPKGRCWRPISPWPPTCSAPPPARSARRHPGAGGRGRSPYRIERMLTHWRLCGALQQLGGIGLGAFSDCDGNSGAASSDCFSLEQVLRERTADLGMPVVAGLPVGHVAGNAALPLGAMAELDGDSGQLRVGPAATQLW